MSAEDTLRPLLTFRLATQHYALAIEQVLEVAAMVAVTTMPDAPPEIFGLANRHGAVLPIIDLRKVFRLPAADLTVSTMFIVADVNNQQIGLLVDEVFQVKYTIEGALKPTHGAGRYVTHIVSDGDTVFQLIDVTPLLATYLAEKEL
ncbi:MAG: chemotaxis protein CheW [Anaerolineae bacterium]|nr:chemotaxis protein CheW [Anaerolineae bacterium]MDQ7036874.1 chemotaxis protein CheW [Anaerolineae bacterium]